MGVRLLVMFSVLIVELGLGIALFLAVGSNYPYRLDEGGIALCVLIAVAMIVSWLMTIAYFIRKSSRAKAKRIVEEARLEAAAILSSATDRAAVLCNLDGGRCKQCGNPRTGKFCPKCGATGEPTATNV
jgi:hypothetical protein